MGAHPASIKGAGRHLVQRILGPQVCARWVGCVCGCVCTRLPVGNYLSVGQRPPAMGGRGGLGKSHTLFSRSGWPSSGDGHSTLYVEGALCVVLSLTRSLKETRGGGSEKAQPGGFPFGSLRLAPLQSCGGLLLDVVNVPRTSKRGRNRAWGMVREPGGRRRRSHLCRGAVDGWMGECGPAGRAPSPSTPGHAPWLPSVPSGPSGCWTSHTGLWRQEPRNNTVHTAHLEAL